MRYSNCLLRILISVFWVLSFNNANTQTNNNAPDIYGAIGDKYNSMGGVNGLPGAMLTKQLPAIDGKGRFQKFKGCAIYWHPAIGAHEVHGVIMQFYLAQKAELNIGYPITDETTCPDGKGKYNHFKKQMPNGTWAESSIYWKPRKQAYLIYGAIREKWASSGWERGRLGYPTSGEYQKGQLRVQDFEKARIVYSAAKGAVIQPYDVY